MHPQSLFAFSALFDGVGIAALAASAALALGARSANLGAALVLGVIAGLFGLALRDLLLRSTIYVLVDPAYGAIAAAAAGVVWAAGPRAKGRTFLWLDAVGLALITASSASGAAEVGVPPLACLVLGVVSGCTGGLARDLIVGRAPLLLGVGVYASAAIAGAALCVVLRMIGAAPLTAAAFSAGATLILRAAAIPSALRALGRSDASSGP